MADVASVCSHITRLSERHGVEPLAVVGLLAVHALCDNNFSQLRFWSNIAAQMHQGLPA